tara:strand:+ start:266 stop:958 length:693 start_codon:yes stop_codon:yes gene_type:complete
MDDELLSFIEENGFIVCYGIAFVFSILNYKKYFDSILKYLPIVIGYTFLNEILGNIIRQNENFQIVYNDGPPVSNSVFYNIFDIVFFLYFIYIFWNLIASPKYKTIVKYGAIIFLISCVINPFIQNFIILPQIYALTVGSIVLVISILLHFKELYWKKNSGPKSKTLLFWMGIGLLTFYVFYPVIMFIGLYYNNIYQNGLKPFFYGLIIFMYSCFTIGFIRMRRMRPVHE